MPGKCFLADVWYVTDFGHNSSPQSFLSDVTKVRTASLGNLYAYEIPSPVRSPTTPREGKKLQNGDAKGVREKNGSATESRQRDNHVGSRVHETHKRSVTNHSALKAHSLGESNERAEEVAQREAATLEVDGDATSTNVKVDRHVDVGNHVAPTTPRVNRR